MYERQVSVTFTRPQSDVVYRILLGALSNWDAMVALGIVDDKMQRIGINAGARLKEAIDKRDLAMREKVQGDDIDLQDLQLDDDQYLDCVPTDEEPFQSTNPALENTEGQRPKNRHCTNCGDTRGGPLGHKTSECAWDGMTESPLDFLAGLDV